MNILLAFKFVAISFAIYLVFRFTLDNSNHFFAKRILFLIAPLLILFATVFTLDVGYYSIPTSFIEQINISDDNKVNSVSNSVFDLFQVIYIVGVLLALLYKLIGYIRLNILFKHSNKVKEIGDISVYESESNINLSFINKIVINKNLTQIEKSQVIEHEIVHIEKRHSIDMIIYNLYSILFWFNPVIYLLLLELKLTHEFEVDSVLVSSDLEIMNPTTKSILYSSIANNYSFNNLKRRFRMKKYSNSKIMPVLMATLTTVFITLFTVFNTNISNAEEKANEKLEVTKQPTYKGDLMAELSKEITYPKAAKDIGAEGRALVKVIINADGKNYSQSIERSSGNEDLDEEAVRAVSTLKEWVPGEADGKKVEVSTIIPIKFKLPKVK